MSSVTDSIDVPENPREGSIDVSYVAALEASVANARRLKTLRLSARIQELARQIGEARALGQLNTMYVLIDEAALAFDELKRIAR